MLTRLPPPSMAALDALGTTADADDFTDPATLHAALRAFVHAGRYDGASRPFVRTALMTIGTGASSTTWSAWAQLWASASVDRVVWGFDLNIGYSSTNAIWGVAGFGLGASGAEVETRIGFAANVVPMSMPNYQLPYPLLVPAGTRLAWRARGNSWGTTSSVTGRIYYQDL